MKHLKKILITLFAIAFLLGACTQQENGNGDEEYTTQENGEQTEIAIGVTPEDFNVNREDLRPHNRGGDWEPEFEEFVDERGVRFGFDRRTGELASISWLFDIINDQPEQAVLSIEEMELLADTTMSHLVDLNKYIRTHFHSADAQMYRHNFRYIRMINSYETTEYGRVWITYSGVVKFVDIINRGLFDDVVIPPIDEPALDAMLISAVHQQFEDVIDIDIEYRILDLRDNQFIMRYEVVVTTERYYDTPFLEFIEIPIPN